MDLLKLMLEKSAMVSPGNRLVISATDTGIIVSVDNTMSGCHVSSERIFSKTEVGCIVFDIFDETVKELNADVNSRVRG